MEEIISFPCKDNVLKTSSYIEFDQKIDRFVLDKLSNHKPDDDTTDKVIYDPVWGTMYFASWEVKLIDCPLIQRLRYISQVGVVDLLYPTAKHTRFEHTLGVATATARMIENLKRKESGKKYIDEEDVIVLRLSALLHDIGHCFFSHLSEKVYVEMDEIKKLKDEFKVFSAAKAHEIFSYIIVNTESFCNFIKENIQIENIQKNQIEKILRKVSKLIIGGYEDSEHKKFLTQIINGQFDSDKLDYLRRDAYTPGLALAYDLDRFLYKIDIFKENNKEELNLVIPISGITSIEEMVFGKFMLGNYIYNHQKVLAAEVLIYDIIESLVLEKKLVHPCDFLNYDDDEILFLSSDKAYKIHEKSNKITKEVVDDFKMRRLPKRALILNQSNVEEDYMYKIIDLADNNSDQIVIREKIHEKALEIQKILGSENPKIKNMIIDLCDIHLVIPKRGSGQDLSNALVLSNEKELKKLSDIIKIDAWVSSFNHHKWNAYVFSKAEFSSIVSLASIVIFKEYGVRFIKEKLTSNLKKVLEIKELKERLEKKYKYDFGY
ncbi:MAG: HD domain-containing protein [Fusobacteriaceae bacterium]